MATTNATIDFPQREPSKSGWAQFKRWILAKIEKYGNCGVNELEMYRTDELVRRRIRSELRAHAGYENRETCVGGAIDTVLREVKYDLSDLGTYRTMNKGVKRTMREWDAYFEQEGFNPCELPSNGRAQIVPKFAAACALHIRSKLGAMEGTEANVLLVQRKYLEVCRRHNVRDVDTVLHQGFVMNAVFTEGVLDDVAQSRKRLPAWIRWLDEVQPSEIVRAQVC